MVQILVVDDDKNIRKLIVAHLKQQGYSPTPVPDGVAALDAMECKHFDLVIADVMMPQKDGYELTADIRTIDQQMPILMVTAKDTFEDKKKGFQTGIDDYMTKPINFDEMMLRVDALLRRAKINSSQKIELGPVCMDLEYRSVTVAGEKIDLPRKEFDLLYKLLNYPKKIFTRRQLMDDIWGMDSEADERTVDVHVKRLREKFRDNGFFEITTVRGLGYKVEYVNEMD